MTLQATIGILFEFLIFALKIFKCDFSRSTPPKLKRHDCKKN